LKIHLRARKSKRRKAENSDSREIVECPQVEAQPARTLEVDTETVPLSVTRKGQEMTKRRNGTRASSAETKRRRQSSRRANDRRSSGMGLCKKKARVSSRNRQRQCSSSSPVRKETLCAGTGEVRKVIGGRGTAHISNGSKPGMNRG